MSLEGDLFPAWLMYATQDDLKEQFSLVVDIHFIIEMLSYWGKGGFGGGGGGVRMWEKRPSNDALPARATRE